jgi:hypothetical protein
MDIGLKPTRATLLLVTGSDFQWSFRWDGGNYPAGSSLYLLVGVSQWDFVITADSAAIKIESTVADAVQDGVGFKLVYKQGNTTPTTETVIAYGQVKRLEPR